MNAPRKRGYFFHTYSHFSYRTQQHFIEIRSLCNWLDKDSHFTRNNDVVIMKQRNYTRAERKNDSISFLWMNNRFLNKLPPLKRVGGKEGSTVHNKSPMIYRSKPVTGSCRALSKSKRGIPASLSLSLLFNRVFTTQRKEHHLYPADGGGMFYRIINIEWQRLGGCCKNS